MLANAKGKTRVLFVGLSLWATAYAGPPTKSIAVNGWPLDMRETSQALLSLDPLMGNLVCPALTRLNLAKLKSEPLLLQALEVNGPRWILVPKPGLKWWDQKDVSAEDISNFVKEELPPALQAQGHNSASAPQMTVQTSEGKVIVEWKTIPPFGPYVFNQLPFRKKSEAFALPYQCAGLLHPSSSSTSLVLESAGAEAKLRLDLSRGAAETEWPKDSPFLNFRFGEELHPPSQKRQVDEALVCNRIIDTPLMTVLAWNPQGRWSGDPIFRRSMTHLLPRGALLRSGAGSLGDLISGPILRAHPGYKRTLLVPAYDPEKADILLNKLGFRRSEEDGYRRTATGELMELRIFVQDFEGSALLRKVLDDSLRALGLKAGFTSEGRGSYDAMLTSIVTSWPDANLRPFLHSQSAASPWPWRYQFDSLDRALDTYAQSLTQQQPDFTLLEKVHDLVYKLEPFSILMQHRACLEANMGKGVSTTRITSARDPDWFPELIGL